MIDTALILIFLSLVARFTYLIREGIRYREDLAIRAWYAAEHAKIRARFKDIRA